MQWNFIMIRAIVNDVPIPQEKLLLDQFQPLGHL